MKLRVVTRRSALALAQTRMVIRDIVAANPGVVCEEIHVETEGDRVQDRSLAEVGGKGLFVKELERALLEDRADIAVHSMKDLPAETAAGLTIAAVPPRESPWDLLVTTDGRPLRDLAHGARVGTSSLRRSIQLTKLRPDLRIEMLRGNVDTRVRRLREGAFDAIVLAHAGVNRLGVAVPGVSLEHELVPAIGQGLLALEARESASDVLRLLAPLEDPASRRAADAERSVMRELAGSCVVPMGAFVGASTHGWLVRGFYASTDGARTATATLSVTAESDLVLVARTMAQGLRVGLGNAQSSS